MITSIDDLDPILSKEEAPVPSRDFVAQVMAAVQQAAGEPPPLRFPWRRFALGIVACAVWAFAGVEVLPGLALLLGDPLSPFIRPDSPLLVGIAAAGVAGLAMLLMARNGARG